MDAPPPPSAAPVISAAAAGAAPLPQPAPATYMEADVAGARLYVLKQMYRGLLKFRPDNYAASWIKETKARFVDKAVTYPIMAMYPRLLEQESVIWMKFKQALTMPGFILPGFAPSYSAKILAGIRGLQSVGYSEFFKCCLPSAGATEQVFLYNDFEYVMSVRNRGYIERCDWEHPTASIKLSWAHVLFQLCLGSHCFGMPFGQRLDQKRRDQTSMQTTSDAVDWSRYSLPAPAHSGKKSVNTCLVVLTLFAAFPELDRVPAQNKAGKAWTDANPASPIGVGETAMGYDVYCISIAEQIYLRGLLPMHRFNTDVHMLETECKHKMRKASDRQVAVAESANARY